MVTMPADMPPIQRMGRMPANRNEISEATVVMTVNKIGQPVSLTAVIVASLRRPVCLNVLRNELM